MSMLGTTKDKKKKGKKKKNKEGSINDGTSAGTIKSKGHSGKLKLQ